MSVPAPPNDDGELELEPIDPEILAAERARAERRTEHARREVEKESQAEHAPPVAGHGADWEAWQPPRITRRRLLIALSLVALAIAALQQFGLGLGLFVVATAGVCLGWFQILRKERLSQNRPETQSPQSVPEDPLQLAAPPKQMAAAAAGALVALAVVEFLTRDAAPLVFGGLALAAFIALMARVRLQPLIVLAMTIVLVGYIVIGIAALMSSKEPPRRSASGSFLPKSSRSFDG